MLDDVIRRFGKQGKAPGGQDSVTLEWTPEVEAAVAAEALAQGDLSHAALHAGAALGADPQRTEWRDLLDRVAQAAGPDPLVVVPLQSGPNADNSYGTVAAHAYFLHRVGRLEDALEMVGQLAFAKPDSDYLAWAVEWLSAPDAASRVRDLSGVKSLFGRVREGLFRGDPGPLREPLFRAHLLPLARAAVARLPQDGLLLGLVVGVLSRIGFPADALEIARAAHAANPGTETAVALSVACRQVDDYPGALAAAIDAVRFNPGEESTWLDQADLYYTTGALEEAARSYETVLERSPEHPWAQPSLWAVLYEMTGDERWSGQLFDYVRAHPDNGRAREVALRQVQFYFGAQLLYPGDATVNIAAQAVPQLPPPNTPGAEYRLTLSAIEAPSAVLSLTHAAADKGHKAVLATSNVQRPDPRQPRGRVEFTLWRYEDTTAYPNVPEPPLPAVQAVAAIAGRPYYALDAWRIAAKQAAPPLMSQFGARAALALLAVMVHPPDRPANTELQWWAWIYRVQIAAALIISQLDTGWNGSLRRRTLLSLANGPMDWTVDAALIAMAVVAESDPAAERELTGLLHELLANPPRPGHVCYEAPALCALQHLPNISDAERAQARRRFQELVSG